MYSLQVSVIRIYHKLTYTELLLNFKGFTSFSCKISLIFFLDRLFKICSNWNSTWHIKNSYLSFLIDKVIKKYLDYKFSSNQNELKEKFDVYYFKLSYIGNLSHHIKYKHSKLCKEFCKENLNIKLVFNSFKFKDSLSYKDPISNDFK